MVKENSLYSETSGGWRCLLDIHGKPMVQWVLDALNAAESVREIFVIGLPKNRKLNSHKPLHSLDEKGGLFENIHAGVIAATDQDPNQTKVLIASGDLPAIRPEMVDWLSGQVSHYPDAKIHYNVITKDTMNSRFPNANRTFVRFKDLTVCGGDLNVVDRELLATENPLWKKLVKSRKNPLKQVNLLGVDSLILIALRLLTLEGAVKRVCRKLKINGRVILSPYAEMGMDADKPYQLEILRKALEGRI